MSSTLDISAAWAGLAEIAAAGGGDYAQPFQPGGQQADRAVQPFHPAVHEQRVRVHADLAEPLPHVRRADDVRHPALVLQAAEHYPPCGSWLLPVRYQPAD